MVDPKSLDDQVAELEQQCAEVEAARGRVQNLEKLLKQLKRLA